MTEKPSTQPADIKAQDSEVHALMKKRVTHHPLGLEYHPDTTFEEWNQLYDFYQGLQDRSQWWLGDSINFAETSKFSDKYTQAVHITGLEYSTLTTIASVCSRIELSRRRADLPFSHHVAVAYLPPQEADRILDQAAKKNWTRDDIRDAVNIAQGLPTKAERQQRKRFAAESGVKTVETKPEPPTLELQVVPQAQTPPQTAEDAPRTSPAPSVALQTAETSIRAFNEVATYLNPGKMRPLERKTWSSLLRFAAELHRKMQEE